MRQSHHHLECAFKAWNAPVDVLFGVITNYRVAVDHGRHSLVFGMGQASSRKKLVETSHGEGRATL